MDGRLAGRPGGLGLLARAATFSCLEARPEGGQGAAPEEGKEDQELFLVSTAAEDEVQRAAAHLAEISSRLL